MASEPRRQGEYARTPGGRQECVVGLEPEKKSVHVENSQTQSALQRVLPSLLTPLWSTAQTPEVSGLTTAWCAVVNGAVLVPPLLVINIVIATDGWLARFAMTNLPPW